MSKLRKNLVGQLTAMPDVSEVTWPGRTDGFTSLEHNGREFAHFHHDHEIDVRLTRSLVRKHGLSHPPDSRHHPKRSVNSPWIEMRFSSKAEVEQIVDLVAELLEKPR